MQVLVDEEDGVVLASALRNHFRSLAVLNMWDPKVSRWLGKRGVAKAVDDDRIVMASHVICSTLLTGWMS